MVDTTATRTPPYLSPAVTARCLGYRMTPMWIRYCAGRIAMTASQSAFVTPRRIHCHHCKRPAIFVRWIQNGGLSRSIDKQTLMLPTWTHAMGIVRQITASGATIVNKKGDDTCCVDRRLITGASPAASNKLGILASEKLLDHLAVNQNEVRTQHKAVIRPRLPRCTAVTVRWFFVVGIAILARFTWFPFTRPNNHLFSIVRVRIGVGAGAARESDSSNARSRQCTIRFPKPAAITSASSAISSMATRSSDTRTSSSSIRIVSLSVPLAAAAATTVVFPKSKLSIVAFSSLATRYDRMYAFEDCQTTSELFAVIRSFVVRTPRNFGWVGLRGPRAVGPFDALT